jgi:hypothetical protein
LTIGTDFRGCGSRSDCCAMSVKPHEVPIFSHTLILFNGKYDSANRAEDTKLRHDDGRDGFISDRAAEVAERGTESRNDMVAAQ